MSTIRARQLVFKILVSLDGVIMGAVVADSHPKRLVVATFDVRGRIMRRATPYDRDGNVVCILGGEYVTARGNVNRDQIRSTGQWTVLVRTAEESVKRVEGRMLFNVLQATGMNLDWGLVFLGRHERKSSAS